MYRVVKEGEGTHWRDRTVLPGRQYRYRIVAVGEGGVSDPVLVTVTIPAWRWPWRGLPGRGESAMPAPSVASSPTPTPEPLALTLVGRSGYLDAAGNFHIFALFRNEQDQDIVGASAQITLLNDNEEVTSRHSGELSTASIAAGATVPLHVVLEGVEPNSYTVSAQGVSGSAPASPLVVEASAGSEGSDGFYYVQGRVRNSGDSEVALPRLAVVLFDRFDRPINASDLTLTPDPLPPGGSATFQVRFDYFPQVRGHQVYVLP